MEFMEFKLDAPLDRYIERIWAMRSDRLNSRGKLFSPLHHEVVFDFAQSLVVSRVDRADVTRPMKTWVTGLQTQPLLCSTNGRHDAVGVMFRPQGLASFTSVPQSELKERSVGLENIFGSVVFDLYEQLQNILTLQDRANWLQRFLLRRLRPHYSSAQLEASLVDLHQSPLKKGIVDELARQLGISSKTLIQRFNRDIGVSPYRYLQLSVLNRVLNQLAPIPTDKNYSITPCYGRLDESLGFHDEPHFVHFFKRYTGFTPGQYRLAQQGRDHSLSANYLPA